MIERPFWVDRIEKAWLEAPILQLSALQRHFSGDVLLLLETFAFLALVRRFRLLWISPYGQRQGVSHGPPWASVADLREAVSSFFRLISKMISPSHTFRSDPAFKIHAL